MVHYLSHSPEETLQLGFEFGQTLKANDVVCLIGELGAGKTTFIKGLVAGAAHYPSEKVQSPTFVYLNIYKGEKVIYHFDLYRLKDTEAFLSMGFEDYLMEGGICCVEWSERISSLLPSTCLFVTLRHVAEDKRQISMEAPANAHLDAPFK